MATLEFLPAELFAIIANHVKATGYSLTPLAATSKHCRLLIEPMLFSRLRLQDSDVPDFSPFVSPDRFKTLRGLEYYINRRDCLCETSDGYRSSAPGSLKVTSMALTSYGHGFSGAIEALLAALDEKSRGTELADVFIQPYTYVSVAIAFQQPGT